MFEDLLSPISSELPCGEFLKLNKSEYRALRNSYNNALSSFRKLIETPDSFQDDDLVSENEENWRVFAELAKDVLVNKTKDIEILCWYITSQIFTKNYIHNVSQIIEILHGWLEKFWDDLNPRVAPNIIESLPEEEVNKRAIEARITPLMQFSGDTLENSALYAPLQMRPLVGEVTFGDYVNARRNNTVNELRQEVLHEYSQDIDDKLQCIEQINIRLNDIEKVICEKCVSAGCIFQIQYLKQVFVKLNQSLEDLFAGKINKSKAISVQQEITDNNNDIEGGDKTTHRGKIRSNAKNRDISEIKMDCAGLNSRDSAFTQLRVIADFFKETEPHSPVPFLIERAIRWGYMSLPELMSEMISQGNEQVLNHIKLLSGMDNLTVAPVQIVSKSTNEETENNESKNSNGREGDAVIEEVPSKDKVPVKRKQSIF